MCIHKYKIQFWTNYLVEEKAGLGQQASTSVVDSRLVGSGSTGLQLYQEKIWEQNFFWYKKLICLFLPQARTQY